MATAKHCKVVSLARIAEVAEVASSTVSRALCSHPNISAYTRRRIRDIAASMGYVPNPMLANVLSEIREQRGASCRGALAWVETVAGKNKDKADMVSKAFLTGGLRQAKLMGFVVEKLTGNDVGHSPLQFRDILRAKRIQGLIIYPDCDEVLEGRCFGSFPFQDFSVASLGAQLRHAGVSAAMNDQYMSSRTAHEQLLRLGYRRVGLVLWAFHVELLAGRFVGGFRSLPGMDAAPVLTIREVNILIPKPCGMGESSLSLDIENFVRRHNLDAIVTSVSVVVFEDLRLRIKKTGRQLGLATLDRQGDENHAGIDQRHEQVGAAVVEMVVSNLLHSGIGADNPVKTTLIEGIWHDGASAPRIV
jgi:LacI family transcriptional regulator